MSAAREITIGAADYLDSLAMIDKPVEIYALDGAALYRVDDDHYVMLECTEHEGHKGHEYLLRVLPAEWECFSSATNVEDEFDVFHYGPEQ